MKKILPITVAFALLASGTVAFAETATTSPLKQLKKEVQTNRTQVKEKIQSLRASTTQQIKGIREELKKEKASTTAERKDIIKKKLEDKAKKHVENVASRVQTRFAATIERLTLIDEKIETRINKFAAMGVKVDDSRTLLTKARADLLTAKGKVEALPAKVQVQVNAAETSKTDILAAIADAKESLKTAHASYIKVVASLKAKGGVKAEQNASTTKATSTEEASTTATSTTN